MFCLCRFYCYVCQVKSVDVGVGGGMVAHNTQSLWKNIVTYDCYYLFFHFLKTDPVPQYRGNTAQFFQCYIR